MLQVGSFYWSEMQQILPTAPSLFQFTISLCPLVKCQPPIWRLSCPAPRDFKLQRVGGRPTRSCQPPAPPPCHKVATKTTTSPAISFYMKSLTMSLICKSRPCVFKGSHDFCWPSQFCRCALQWAFKTFSRDRDLSKKNHSLQIFSRLWLKGGNINLYPIVAVLPFWCFCCG